VPSSVIRRFTYDPATAALDVEFVSGKRYRYLEVPSELAQAFRSAFAKGRFFNARIRQFANRALTMDESSALDALQPAPISWAYRTGDADAHAG
jgi:hypothetical protein